MSVVSETSFNQSLYDEFKRFLGYAEQPYCLSDIVPRKILLSCRNILKTNYFWYIDKNYVESTAEFSCKYDIYSSLLAGL